MLRRDQPNGDRTELSEMLRRLSRTGGSVTVSLGGETIARVDPRPVKPSGAEPAVQPPPPGDDGA
ncbi:hypothetical protein VSS74_07615 [Conexibacter stalactiti]|uniref:Type II toxin-antitoxin system prevent-host-death family antitoxin n=1 Tax=Conexibacter stalactiti TaxID=1940611 RepID=A0ABU4HLN1_9ACTN|nr:hypothetical protein [Conexibacter stalactiti]MDW5594197.1 hypothetical protein [Conexibacter stalactiti]MEC5034839.1 hypothetical protein [Conexibacter stalactiti]